MVFSAQLRSPNEEMEFPYSLEGVVIAGRQVFPSIYLLRTYYEPGCAEYKSGFFSTRSFFSTQTSGNLLFRLSYGPGAIEAIYASEVEFTIDNDLNFTDNVEIEGYSMSNTVCYPGGSFLSFGASVEIDIGGWPYPCQQFYAAIKGFDGGDHLITTGNVVTPNEFTTIPAQSSYEIEQYFNYEEISLNWKASVDNGPDRNAKPLSTPIRIYHGFQANDIIVPNPPSGDTMYCGDLLVLRADPMPNLAFQGRIEYCWQIIQANPPPPVNGVFPNGNCVHTRENTFRADYPGDIQIRYRIKDGPTEYYSEYSNTITLHLAPKIEITRPNSLDYKFTFDAQTPDGVLKIPAKAIVEPTQMIPDLIWDITPIVGSNLVINPGPTMDTVVFVFTGLPASNSEFGQKWVYASFPAWDAKDSVIALAFFSKDIDNHPGRVTANWFFYWQEGDVVPNMAGVGYDPMLIGYGQTSNGVITIGPAAATIHYPGGYIINGIHFGGNHVNGVDCTAEVVAHERYHAWVFSNWRGGQWFIDYGPRTTGPGGNDRDGDWLANEYETSVSNTDPDNPDTHDVARIRHYPPYYSYGDQEYMAMVAGNGVTGDHLRDWSAGLYSKQWP